MTLLDNSIRALARYGSENGHPIDQYAINTKFEVVPKEEGRGWFGKPDNQKMRNVSTVYCSEILLSKLEAFTQDLTTLTKAEKGLKALLGRSKDLATSNLIQGTIFKLERIIAAKSEIANEEKRAEEPLPMTRAEARFFYLVYTTGSGAERIEKPDILCTKEELAEKAKDQQKLPSICKVSPKQLEKLSQDPQYRIVILRTDQKGGGTLILKRPKVIKVVEPSYSSNSPEFKMMVDKWKASHSDDSLDSTVSSTNGGSPTDTPDRKTTVGEWIRIDSQDSLDSLDTEDAF